MKRAGRPAVALVLLAALGGAIIARADDPAFARWWKEQRRRFQDNRKKPHVQLAIIRSIGKRPELRPAGLLLLQLLQLPDPRQRLTALQTLADARFAKLAPALAASYPRIHKPSLRFEVELVETFGALGAADGPVIELLRKLLQRQELVLLRHTLAVLRRLNKPACVEPVIGLLLATFPPRDVRLAGSTVASAFPWQRYHELERSLRETLRVLVDKQFETQEEWRAWYNDYKKKK